MPAFKVVPRKASNLKGQSLKGRASAEQLALSEHRLAELSRQIETLTSRLAHDLRNPLNLIVGYADLLNMESFGPLTEKQKSFVAAIQGGARELGQEIARAQERLDALVKTGAKP